VGGSEIATTVVNRRGIGIIMANATIKKSKPTLGYAKPATVDCGTLLTNARRFIRNW
jgi:hypothetical protein